MPVFEYAGYDAKGKLHKRQTREADSPKALRGLLRKEGFRVTEVNSSDGKKKGKGKGGDSFLSKDFEVNFQRINVDDVGNATRQLATLLQSGVPMVDSLTAIIDQIENKAFKRIFAQIKDEVNEGKGLADALAKHKCFDNVYVNMVRAGESSGTLDIVLERLADFKEGQADLKSEVMGTMMYPIIMVFVGVGIMGILFTVVVPRITRIFENANAQLPIMTRILIGTSEILGSWWWLILILMVAGVVLLVRWLKTEKGKATWDRWSLKLPIFGTLFRMMAVSRFSRTLGTLLQSGVPLLTSLDITRNVVSNSVISKAVDDTKEAIREGEEIAPPLKRSKQFPPMVVHMVAIGERSGQLEQMLERVANAYEKRVERRLKTVTSLLEPLMILGMAGVVGFIVFAILMPILQMNTLVGK